MAPIRSALPDDCVVPEGGWPAWLWTVPYASAWHPQASASAPIEEGANCQRYAYSVLELFGVRIPCHRSSELWADPNFEHPARAVAQPLDLVLFNREPRAYGAHVAVHIADDHLLHLCEEVGRPVIWRWADFAARPRYASVLGLVRPIRTNIPTA